jgi:hypothetical protein
MTKHQKQTISKNQSGSEPNVHPTKNKIKNPFRQAGSRAAALTKELQP